MSTTSSQFQPVADPTRRLAPDAAAIAASRAASRPSASPLVAQITVRAIQTALEKTHVNMPGTSDRAAVIEIDPGLAARAARAVEGDLGAGDAITRVADVLGSGTSPAAGPSAATRSRPAGGASDGGASISVSSSGGVSAGSVSAGGVSLGGTSRGGASIDGYRATPPERSAGSFSGLLNLDALRAQVAGGTLPIDDRALAFSLLHH